MKTKAKNTQSTEPGAKEDRGAKRAGFGIYRDGNKTLFVPQINMWKLREMFATDAKGGREAGVEGSRS
jgi:hypothetical protein